MIVDPWASPARPAATSAWNDQMDTVTTGQPDVWLARRSPSPGWTLVEICMLSTAANHSMCVLGF